MKNILVLCLAVMMCLPAISQPVLAEDNDTTVTVDREIVRFDQPPVIIVERTFVPIRTVYETIGETVEWNASTETVFISKDNEELSLNVGSRTMQINKGTPEHLDVPVVF